MIREQDAKIQSLEEKTKYQEIYTSIKSKLIGVFDYKSKSPTYLEIPEEIPSSAKSVLVLAYLSTGAEGPERTFMTELWTEIDGEKCKKAIRGTRYPQSAISYSSENMWFPIKTERRIHIQCDDIQSENCHNLEVFVLGYRN